MSIRRSILEPLSRARLLELASVFGLEGLSGKKKDEVIAKLARSRTLSDDDALVLLSRNELKTLCRDLGLEDSGRAKAVLVERILNPEAEQERGGGNQGHQESAGKEQPRRRTDVKEADKTGGQRRGRKRKDKNGNSSGANLGFEQTLWLAADKLRGHMDASEYKHVVLGLIFLKYISDAFQERYDQLAAMQDTEFTDPEDRDEYTGENVFWVPKVARWSAIQAKAKTPEIGKKIDDAMVAIEKENPSLKGVLPKDYNRPALDKTRLGELIDLVGTMGLGDKQSRSKDILGRVYEYFLGKFASAEGKGGGEFYTPRCVVRLLVEMIEPYKGRVFDPCCGSGGMFVQSEKFVEEHGGGLGDISIFGQESNSTTWKLAKMNLAIRGIDADLGPHQADSFHNDLHKDLRVNFLLANPPFNDSDWGGDRLRDDARWQFGVPPRGNANYAWISHFISKLRPNGVAGFVLANGSMSSNSSGEGEIRRAIIEADLVDCMIALPGQLFYTTGIPACLWFLARDKRNGKFRDRRGETLFIDARKLGQLIDRTHRDLSEEEILRIARTYHAWRGEKNAGKYEDVSGFCKAARSEEIAEHGYVLTPGRYVGAEDLEDDEEPFEVRMKRLTGILQEQFMHSQQLEGQIRQTLGSIGYRV